MPLVWVAPRGSPPCRMGPIYSRDAGKCSCGYLVIFLGQGVPCCCCVLVTWGFEAVLGGWWARGWSVCVRVLVTPSSATTLCLSQPVREFWQVPNCRERFAQKDFCFGFPLSIKRVTALLCLPTGVLRA